MSKSIRTVILILAMSLLLVTVVSASDGPHWSYEGDTGPAYWGELSPDYALCSTGQTQSPIDIPSTAPTNPADLGFGYEPSALNIFNNGHTIQVNYDEGSSLKIDGDVYKLVQFHFHAASEHTIDGSARPMELHLVHQNAQGRLAVVGVMLEDGLENPAYAPIFANLPAEAGEPKAVPGVIINADDLLPETTTYWRYNGSLTTPPCSEGVKWLVMNNTVDLSPEQIAAYTSIYSNTARPTQPMNERQFIVGQQPQTLPTTGADQSSQAPTLLIIVGALAVVATAGGYAVYRRKAA